MVTTMGQLFVVRHGQASIQAADYDQLSETGTRQAEALGRYWLALGLRWDQLVIGPRRRHRQTYDAVAAVYQAAGVTLPPPRVMDAFDEHAGPGVVKRTLAEEAAAAGRELPSAAALADAEQLKVYFRRYQTLTRQWVRGELAATDVESFQTFRQRTGAGLTALTEDGQGQQIAVFTSGGPVAAVAGHSLGLADERVLELSWTVRNAGFAECRFRPDAVSLVSFNGLPHLTDAALHTLV